MDAAQDNRPRVALIEGEAVIHQRFGGAGPSSRQTPRENAHAALMRCTDSDGDPAPKCSASAGHGGFDHSRDCDEATGLLEQLRALGFGNG